MTRAIAIVVTGVVGCANAYQSARVLSPGKTQVTVAVSRTEAVSVDEGDDAPLWLGDLQVRHGFTEKFDGGVRLMRSPGGGNTLSILSLDPKLALTAPDARTAVAVGVPIGIMWTEDGSDFERSAILITPSLLVGIQMAPGIDLVVSPKLFVIVPKGKDIETELGGSIGVRIGDPSRTWAVHPEIGLIRFSEGGDSSSYLMFGVGIAAGD